MSLQDFLLQQGYAVSMEEGAFTKWQHGWKRVEIPFTALAGHTLESFQRLARKKEWIETEEPKDFFGEPGIFCWGTA